MNRKLALLPILIFPLFSCAPETKTYEMQDYILEMPYKADFKILQLTDIHVSNKDNLNYQFNYLDSIISVAEPDMIIATGDLFTFADQRTAISLFDFFTQHEIPWTVTFGNHDEQCYFSIDWLTGYLNDLSLDKANTYCYFIDHQDDDVTGNANFAINLMAGDTLVEQLIIMDSNRYYFGSYWGYDWIKDDQVEWYRNLVRYTKSHYTNRSILASSLAFFHIPLYEFNDAYDAYVSNSSDAVYIHGEKNEKTCNAQYNSGLFDAILEENWTKGVFVGHDHINDFAIKYKDVVLSYGVTSTDRIYYQEGMIGGKVITLRNTPSTVTGYNFDIDCIFAAYPEV